MSANSNDQSTISTDKWDELKAELKGDLFYDHGMRTLYATDASSYRVFPQAVALPRDSEDMRRIVEFARDNKVPITPRAAGTSLSGLSSATAFRT